MNDYKVLVVEDQRSAKALAATFDRRKKDGAPSLEFAGLATSLTDAISYLEGPPEEWPDAVVIDDYLTVKGGTQSQALEFMRELCKGCIRHDVAPADRPRAVLWSTCTPNFVYTFCALGGMQYRFKKGPGGESFPFQEVWLALAGQRWRPSPYPVSSQLPVGLQRALPYLEAGWQNAAIQHELGDVTLDQLKGFVDDVRKMPLTPIKTQPGTPVNAIQALEYVRKHGWVWAKLEHHQLLPNGAPFGPVINPDAFREPLPPHGPLPAGVSELTSLQSV